MNIEIKNRWTGSVIASGEFMSLGLAVEHSKNVLRGADLRDSDLSGSDLSGSNLSGSNLRSSNLSSSDLRGSDLSDSNLRGSNLRYSDLSYSNLSDSNLRYSDLRGSNLSGSDLSDSDLSGSDLRGSNLRDSDLSCALIDGKPIVTMRVFSGLYRYTVQAVLFKDGSRKVRMGCLWKSLAEWEAVEIRKSNTSEFPDDGSDRCEERVAAFEFAKAAALRLKETQC